jgi:hypothetical protein
MTSAADVTWQSGVWVGVVVYRVIVDDAKLLFLGMLAGLTIEANAVVNCGIFRSCPASLRYGLAVETNARSIN